MKVGVFFFFALLAALCLLMVPAAAEPLQPGDPAPHLELLQGDSVTSRPMVLLFIKEDDRYSARALEELRDLQQRGSEFLFEIRIIVVLSRMQKEAAERMELPPSWVLVRDKNDTLYNAYRIIATPTAVVISGGDVIGYHPGYSTNLMRLIQQDLLMELHGRDVLRTPAPVISAELQMGRRLAERGLWERALPYYRKAAKSEAFDERTLLDFARVLIESHELEEGRQVLEQLKDSQEAAELRERVRQIEEQRSGAPDA